MSRKQSSFRATHFNIPQNYVDKIEPKGVDLSSPQMEVSADRAVYGMNYVFDGSKAKKRFGYSKVGYVPEVNGRHMPITGMVSFVGEITKTKRTVAFVKGGEPKEAIFSNGRFSFVDIEGSSVPSGTVGAKSFTVVENYVGGVTGNGVSVIGETDSTANRNIRFWDIGEVEAYVPTTTTLIVPTNADPMPTSSSAFLEAPNKLTDKRKNTLLAGTGTKGKWATFRLDAAVSDVESVEIEGNGYLFYDSATGEYRRSWLYGFYGVPSLLNYRKLNTGIVNIRASAIPTDSGVFKLDNVDASTVTEDEFSKIINGDNILILENNTGFRLEKDSGVSKLYALARKSGDDAEFYVGLETEVANGKTYYKMKLVVGFVNVSEGTLTLINPIANPTAGANLTIEFRADADVGGDDIAKCRYCARFGHNNSLNHIWVYGNPDKPNYAWRTGTPAFPKDTAQSYTYFPADVFYKFGEPSSSIVGMEVVSETKMMVLKTKGGNGPTMYFVTPTVVTSTIGTAESESEEYSVFPSNTITAGSNPEAVANFNGDVVFISDEGELVGLDIEGITGDSRRAAYSRSRYIDKELKKLNRDSVKVFAFSDYLIIDSDTKTFVAHRSQFDFETRQYEWWPIDNMNAVCFFEDDDGNVFFTDDEGGIYMLDGHTDFKRYFLNMGTGDLTYYMPTGYGKTCFVTTQSIMDEIAKGGWKANHREEDEGTLMVEMPEKAITRLPYYHSDGKYYFDMTEAAGDFSKFVYDGATLRLFGTDYQISVVDDYAWFGMQENLTGLRSVRAFYVYLTDTDKPKYEQDISKGVFVESLAKLPPGEYGIEVIKDSENQERNVAFTFGDGLADSFIIDGQPFSLEISKETPIKSVWMSRPVPIAKFSYDKTIKQVDVYNDTDEAGELYVGCVTNKQLHTYNLARIREFDFSDIDFEELTFDRKNVPVVYHMRRFPRRQQYFSLIQMSDSEANSLLSDMDVTYTLQGIARNKH